MRLGQTGHELPLYIFMLMNGNVLLPAVPKNVLGISFEVFF